jgi:TatD DNase family protein
VHTRQASDDTLAILTADGRGEVGGVFHCFTETAAVARAALDLGFYISFSGIVTFKNAQDLRDVVAMVPLDRMLIETDSPYLAPVPMRGKTNEPAFVSHVADAVARIKGVSIEVLADVTTRNVDALFSRITEGATAC